MENSRTSNNAHIISYNLLRKLIGFIGIFLPIVLVIGSFLSGKYDSIQPSISDYYFTTMGDVFVGNLCAVSLFLFCYKGYDYRDNLTANLAAFFAVCVALFPTTTHLDRNHLGLIENPEVASVLHFTSAALFFCCLAFFCLYLFKMSKGYLTKKKKLRNRVYTICGILILASIIILAADHFIEPLNRVLKPYNPVILLETVALWAFGISWITKGQAILADMENESKKS